MAIDLVTTPGDPTANSYPTVEEFDAYWETRSPVPAAVAAANVEQKKSWLVQGTRAVDESFKWTGSATEPDTQALCWPRTGMSNRNGGAIGDDVIPAGLKNSVCEWAGQAAAKDLQADNEAAKQNIASVKAGSVSVAFQPRTNNKEAQETDVVRMGSDFFYLSVPDEVRRLLVPSWYEATTTLTPTGRPFVFESLGGGH